MQSIRNLLPAQHRLQNAPASVAGFTIIELLIATMVFSVVMLLIAIGVMQFNHAYYNGITQTNTQDVARSILEGISQDIQFTGDQVTSPIGNGGSEQGFCIGSDRYSYRLGWQLVDSGPIAAQHQTTHALVKDSPGLCGGMNAQNFNNPLAAGSTELLSPHMRLSKLSVSQVPGTTTMYNIDVRVVYGDDDLLSNPTANNAACKILSGSQFCAVSELSTVVQKRL